MDPDAAEHNTRAARKFQGSDTATRTSQWRCQIEPRGRLPWPSPLVRAPGDPATNAVGSAGYHCCATVEWSVWTKTKRKAVANG